MPGFTAINARFAGALPSAASELSATDDSKTGPQKPKRRQAARRTAEVSNDPTEVRDTVPTETITRSRISGEGRKRKTPSNESTEPKRRKNGRVQSGMSTSKPGVNTTATPDERPATKADEPFSTSTYTGGLSATSKAKLDGFRYNAKQAVTGQDTRADWAQALPMYTSQTSTSISQQSQLQTTMQAVAQSSQGRSLLYSSSATLPDPGNVTGISQPPLSSPALPKKAKARIEMPSRPLAQTPTPANLDPLVHPARNVSQYGKNSASASSNTICAPSTPAKNGDGCGARQLPTRSDHDHRNNLSKHRRLSRAISEDYIDEDEMIELTKREEESTRSRKPPTSRDWKLNVREVDQNEDYGGALFSKEERNLLSPSPRPPSPSTQTSNLSLDALKPPSHPKPIARSPFPTLIQDRTSLTGLSNNTVLRTCFRVGEALNTGSQAARSNQNVILELYARVTQSWREAKPSRKQHFVIHDLYHDRPPFLNGTFELWDQSVLWEEDSRSFLEAGVEGVMCRMIAKMKRDGAKWRLEILSIWQADWEDVEHVAGIYTNPTPSEMSGG